MKKFNFLSKLWSSVAGSQRNDVEFDRRLTVGSPSGFTINWTLKLVSVLVLVLSLGSGNVWGAENDTHDFTQTLSQLLNNNASIADVTVAEQSYTVKSVIVTVNYNKTAGGATVSVKVGGTTFGSAQTINSSTTTTFTYNGASAIKGQVVVSSVNNCGNGTGKGTFKITNVRLVEGAAAVATPYTVTFTKTDGTTQAITEASAGAGVTPPTLQATCGDWEFQGWSKSQSTSTTSTTVLTTVTLTAGKYYPTANTTLYPVYTRTTGSSGKITFTPGTDTGATSVTKTGVTCTMTTMNNASYYQIYANGSGTFSNASGNITKIEFTCTASGTDKYGPGNVSANVGSYSYSGTDGTWTGSSASVTLSASKQVRMSALSVSYSNVSTYYYSYPSCCTELASINGSVNWGKGNAKLIWDKDSHASGYTVKWKTTAGGADTYSTTYVTTIKDTLTNKKTCSVTNLTGGSSYNFKIIATGQTTPSLYCDKEEILTSTAPKINASGTLTGSDYETSSGPGKVKTFDVSGVGLIAGSLTFAVPTSPAQYFEISTDNGSSWGSSKTLAVSAGTLAATTIKVRLKAGLSSGTYGPHTITISGGGAANNTSVTIAGTAISVTVQKKDETGATISDAGVTATASGTSLTASAGSTNYVFHTWKYGTASGTSIADASSAITSLTGTPTGDVIVIAEFYKPRTIVWKVNNTTYTPGTPGTATTRHNTAWSALTLPTDPDVSNYCGQKFVGWTTTDMGESSYDKDDDADAIEDLDLMTSENQSTKTEQKIIDATTTFHAVFADYDE